MMNKYEIVKEIGSGSYGKVYEVKSKLTGEIFALKKMRFIEQNRKDNTYLLNELKILSFNKSNYLLKAHDIFIDGLDICIITDIGKKGDLRRYIDRMRRRHTNIKESLIWNILIQLCLGVNYLHSYNIIHRDLKTANIFINSDESIMIGDFGVSKILKPNFDCANTQIGTPYYISPEIVKGKKYNKKIDVWSIGCILCEMMTREYAFKSENIHALNYKIINGSYQLNNNHYSSDLVDLVKKMIEPDIQKRPDILDILTSDCILDKIKNGCYEVDKLGDKRVNRNLNRYLVVPYKLAELYTVIRTINQCNNLNLSRSPPSCIPYLPPTKRYSYTPPTYNYRNRRYLPRNQVLPPININNNRLY